MNEGPSATARAHTAEHVLSAVMASLHGSPRNTAAHLGAKKSRVDFPVDRPIDDADARPIEDAVNAAIRADHPVAVALLPRADAAERVDLTKVPADADPIRVVRIGDLDETACVGDHVGRTSEIGRFVLRSLTMIDAQTVRIRFGLEAGDAE